MAKQKNTISEYRNYYMPPEFPIQFLSGNFWTISQDRPDRLHFHNCLEIGLCLQNRGEMEFYGERFPYKAGDITVIPRNVPHSTWAYPGETSLWTYLMLDPQILFHDLLPDFEKEYDLYLHHAESFYIFHQDEHPELYELLQLVMEELKKQQSHYQTITKSLLLAFYMKAFRIQNARIRDAEVSASSAAHAFESRLTISPALDYIESYYMQQFTIEALASMCHFSPTHFRRVFHETMGTSPLDFINTTRVMKACDLLRLTEDPILNISEMVGFHSISSFNRLFIKIMNMSPREYRKHVGTSSAKIYRDPDGDT